ncbi:hypothetical protein TELCIR_24592, partial [Teladorsagia circumcincta]
MNTIIYFIAFAGVVLSAPGSKDSLRGRGDHESLKDALLPPFLRNVTAEARKEYFEIVTSQNETIAEQKKDVLEWAKRNDVADGVNEYNTNISNIKQELRKNVTELIERLPSALEDFSKVMENDDQTHAELKQALKDLIAEKPKEYSVLFFALGKEIFSGHHKDLKDILGASKGKKSSNRSQ